MSMKIGWGSVGRLLIGAAIGVAAAMTYSPAQCERGESAAFAPAATEIEAGRSDESSALAPCQGLEMRQAKARAELRIPELPASKGPLRSG